MRQITTQARIGLAAIAVSVFAAGQRMTDWAQNVSVVVAVALLATAAFYNQLERLLRRRRLRGIRIEQWPYEDHPTELHVTLDVEVSGLLITCSPETAIISNPKARATQRTSTGRIHHFEPMATGYGNRVVLLFSNVHRDTGEWLQTKVRVELTAGVRVTDVERLTEKIAKQFATDQQ